eukprot:scaffold329_cov390-Pavlova_lutheri.AAC.7
MVLWVSGRVLRSTHPGNMQWVCAYSSGKTGARPRSLAPKLSLALLYLNFHWTFLPIMTNGNHHIAHWGACYCGAARSYFHARDQCSFRDYGQLSLCCSRWQGKAPFPWPSWNPHITLYIVAPELALEEVVLGKPGQPLWNFEALQKARCVEEPSTKVVCKATTEYKVAFRGQTMT